MIWNSLLESARATHRTLRYSSQPPALTSMIVSKLTPESEMHSRHAGRLGGCVFAKLGSGFGLAGGAAAGDDGGAAAGLGV